MVATESEESSAEVPFYAVEEDMMREVRAWWQQRAVHCKPFWLYGGVAHMPTPLLRASMDKYEEVSSQVLTQQPADLLRALYPLVRPSPPPPFRRQPAQYCHLAPLTLFGMRVSCSMCQWRTKTSWWSWCRRSTTALAAQSPSCAT